MKKIKKILMLLLAFSFTTLLFNSQAYAVEYYSFEFTVTDATDQYDVQFTPNDIFDEIILFVKENGVYDDISNQYILDNVTFMNESDAVLTVNDNDLLTLLGSGVIDFEFDSGILYSTGIIFIEQTYICITDIPITFTKTFWDQIIDVIGDIAVAFQTSASAGISLIYDGTALTSLGEIITITLGVGLVIGLFYLVIRVLPGARL